MVLVIAAVLAMLAGPGFQDMQERNRRLSALESMVSALATARSEAVSRVAPVSLCASDDQSTCNTNNWEAGAIIFVDDGEGGGTAEDRDVSGGEDVIRYLPAAGPGITVRSSGFPEAGGILFDNEGFAEARGTLVICNRRGAAEASAIILNRSGQTRLGTDGNNNGIVEDHTIPTAQDVTCP